MRDVTDHVHRANHLESCGVMQIVSTLLGLVLFIYSASQV